MPDREPAGVDEVLAIDGEARRVALNVIATQPAVFAPAPVSEQVAKA
jgi:hypothetical protein